jgi:hypothetical protein
MARPRGRLTAAPGTAPGAPLSSEDGTRTGRPGPFCVLADRIPNAGRTLPASPAEYELSAPIPDAFRECGPERAIQTPPEPPAERRQGPESGATNTAITEGVSLGLSVLRRR